MAKNKYIDQRFFTNGKSSNLSLTNKLDLKKYIQQVAGSSLIDTTYDNLKTSLKDKTLTPGSLYLISDYRTCYDRPDYDIYRNPIVVSNQSYVEENIDPIIVLAIGTGELALEAYQPSYPFDTIKYDISYDTTESGGVAYGRIIERVDEWGNRTDYDHRVITFKRYTLRTYNALNPLQGTVQLQSDGTVLGSGTLFTNLLPGDVIAIRFSNETFYQITSIIDDTTMTVKGNVITDTGGGGYQFFNTDSWDYDSYYPNNVDDEIKYQLYQTFEAVNNNGCYNTYIGDHSLYYLTQGTGDFLLANNVLKSGIYQNNIIGDSSYNNTFNDDCTANKIGYGFRNNITDDDFDSNVIGNFFNNNIITANFQYNQIGLNFENNVILCNSFYRNQIGNYFSVNWLDGDNGFDFQNNQIGNQFAGNEIYRPFYKNIILNGYNQNQIWSEFVGNKIGNGFNGNDTYAQFNDNIINDYFDNNTIGDPLNIGSGSFYDNIVGNSASSNTIVGNFYGNQIGIDFQSNTIASDFRYNQILYPVFATDFSSATHVYADYNCRIIKSDDSNLYLEYLLTGIPTYVSITA